jgi:hypothetical protein
MAQNLIQLLEGSTLNIWVLSTAWLWPLLEILHFVGLSLLLGAMLVIDIRMAGFVQKMHIQRTHDLLPVAGIGFLINTLTGVLFFVGDPARYAINVGFQIKMLLVLIAGLNALWFAIKINPEMHRAQQSNTKHFNLKPNINSIASRITHKKQYAG